MRLGIDLGGTKIAAVVLDGDGQVVWETRRETPRHDYDGTLRALADIVARGEAAVGRACTVGVGMPGSTSRATGLIRNANSVWLNGRPFHRDLEAQLGRPVRLANDANCLAVSEADDGSGRGARVVVGAILGTGVGGGLVVDGRLVEGANGIAGEWGHNPLPWPEGDEIPGPPCYCGRAGCIEVFVSGPGLKADYVRRGGMPHRTEEIVARADAGEARAQAALEAWQRRLAKSFATLINVIDPDVIVVGGGLSRVARLYEAVPRLWGPWVFSDAVLTRLVAARHGDASGVRGAARLWPGA
jgi:fructokinase